MKGQTEACSIRFRTYLDFVGRLTLILLTSCVFSVCSNESMYGQNIIAGGVHDVMATTVLAKCGDPDKPGSSLAFSEISNDLAILSEGSDMEWLKTKLHKIAKDGLNVPAHDDKVDRYQAYIFHIGHWMPGPTHRLVSSDWYVYKARSDTKLQPTGTTPAGEPSLYGLKRALIVGVEVVENDGKFGPIKIAYKSSVAQGTPGNSQALGQLVSALLGLATKSASFDDSEGCSVLTAVFFQEGTKQLPFDLNIALSAYDSSKLKPICTADTSKQNASGGVADCPDLSTGSTCSLTRKFTSQDREWWDIGIGVTIPGVRENQFSIANGAVNKTTKTHTDLYGMLDIYPFAYRWTKDSAIPHFNIGLPLTSQTFYRPFFGISENLTGWNILQKRLGLPAGLNLFGGIVYMKTAILQGSPTTTSALASDLRHERVLKPLIGVEVPVMSLINKVGKSGAKNSNSGGSGNSGAKQGTN
jgi:hypothetical protein